MGRSIFITVTLLTIITYGIALFLPLASWSIIDYSYYTASTWEPLGMLLTLPLILWSILAGKRVLTLLLWGTQAGIHFHLFTILNIDIPEWLLWLKDYNTVTIRYGIYLLLISWFITPILPFLTFLRFFREGLKHRPNKLAEASGVQKKLLAAK